MLEAARNAPAGSTHQHPAGGTSRPSPPRHGDGTHTSEPGHLRTGAGRREGAPRGKSDPGVQKRGGGSPGCSGSRPQKPSRHVRKRPRGPPGPGPTALGPGKPLLRAARTAPAAAYSLQEKSFSSPALTSAGRSPELRVRARRREASRPTGPSAWTAGRRATTAPTPRPRGRARAAAKWRRPPAPSAHPFPAGPGAALPSVASDPGLPSAVVLRAQAPSRSQAKPPPFEESIRTLPPEQPPAFLTPFPKETAYSEAYKTGGVAETGIGMEWSSRRRFGCCSLQGSSLC
ncbi:uncharacterized protein [Vicugna pacos]|uniref:Basic proline-rich protein-like n=1 Tax=Vicugna pacos TaxID=30538 RepID=A0ABM5D9U9_VICPA